MKTSPRKGGRGLPAKLAAVLACLFLALTAGTRLSAQSLSGWLTEYPHTAYAAVSSQFRLDSAKVDGQTYMGGSANLFCVDLPGTSIDSDISTYPHYISTFTLGTMDEMNIWDRFSTPQNEALAQSMAHWAVDNFYLDYFLQPANNTNERQYAFQNLLWEVFADGGTSNGLNWATGNVIRTKFGPSGSNDSPQLWTYMNRMLDGLVAAGVTTSYQPVYQMVAVLDARSSYQDYLLVPNDPQYLPVPELSTSALWVAALGLLLWRRRR